jgi:hypothetical protein
MKRLIFAIMLLAAIAIPAAAQTPTTTTPQGVTNATVLNGVSTAQASGCLFNLGQTTHFVFYSAGGAGGNPTGVKIRIEASFNSDSATCATGTWFPISDDGIEPGQNQTGMILGIGAFPFLRVNLANCGACDASDTISASYTGTSAVPGNPFGTYGAGQQIRKVQWIGQTGTIANAPPIISPYGSSAGYAVLVGTNTFSTGSVSQQCLDPGGSLFNTTTLPTTASIVAVPVPATPCNLIRLRCGSCQATGGTISAYYFFYPPGAAMPDSIQPASTKNSEATAVNATVTTTLTVSGTQRAHLFLFNARCSAGTAGVTVADGATQIFSSAAAEVGTTSFTKPFNPALASSPGNNLVISLTTCGAANTGTLDVQGSVGP